MSNSNQPLSVEASKSGLKIINVKKKKKNMIKYQRCNIFFFHVILTLIKISPSKDHYPLHHFLRYNLLHFSSFSFTSLINPYFTPFPGYNNESNLYSIVHS